MRLLNLNASRFLSNHFQFIFLMQLFLNTQLRNINFTTRSDCATLESSFHTNNYALNILRVKFLLFFTEHALAVILLDF